MSRPRSIPGRKVNPLRELVAEKQRSAGLVRARQNTERLNADLPDILSDRVGEHIQKLETKLLKDFQEMGQRAVEESTNVLSEQLSERIETLEQISALQSRTIVRLRDSSKVADQKVSSVVNNIEKTLSGAVPGFRLAPSAFAPTAFAGPELAAPSTVLIKAETREMSETNWKLGYCPKCTSTQVRRANRSGIWEEFLRLFFIAPFRCRACRHKFYRF
jgi:hypothetical protein